MTDTKLPCDATAIGRLDVLIAQHGPVLGPDLYARELEVQQKRAHHARDQQMQLAALNARIEVRMRENDAALVPLTERMEKSYAAWLHDCQARDAKLASDQGALLELRNAAAVLIKAINQPDANFTGRVRNWSRPVGYVEEVDPPMPNPMRVRG